MDALIGWWARNPIAANLLMVGIVLAGGDGTGLVPTPQDEVGSSLLLGDVDRFVASVLRCEQMDDRLAAGELLASAPPRRRDRV